MPTICPAGKYGSSTGLADSNCSGSCSAGILILMRFFEAIGNYCPLGSSAQTPCPAGSFGKDTGLDSPSCSGLCPIGKYSTSGSSDCEDCSPNFTTFASGSAKCLPICNAGFFIDDTSCTPCQAGYYGDSVAAKKTQSTCAGLCLAGYFCTSGTDLKEGNECPSGTYSEAGATKCSPCSAGIFIIRI